MRRYARARSVGHTPGKMNGLEARYSDELEARKQAGEILSWRFEPIKLRLADRTWYTPDFIVVAKDRTLEAHEVKGRWLPEGRVKTKVAAELFPEFLFIAITERRKKDGGGWAIERF